jgi:hypothetical protein
MVQLRVGAGRGRATTTTTQEEWARNSEWLDMPNFAYDDYKIAILCRIDEGEENYFGFYIDTNPAYNITIDWGDGTLESTQSRQDSYHEYDYSNSELDSSLTSDGYKQALIIITLPIDVTVYNFYLTRQRIGKWAYHTAKYLDVKVAVPTLQGFRASQSTAYAPVFLEHIEIVSANFSNFIQTFYFCTSLQKVTIGDNVTVSSSTLNCQNMFFYCYNLPNKEIHSLINRLLNNKSITDAYRMFHSCFQLIEGPPLDTSTLTRTQEMFTSCYGLIKVPLYDFSNATGGYATFQSCYSLTEVPHFDTSSYTDMRRYFTSCQSLSTIPAFNTSNVIYMDNFLNGCINLLYIPQLDTSKVTNFNNFFTSCYALESVPQLDYSSATGNAFNMTFWACYSLKSPIKINANISGANAGLYRTFYGAWQVPKITIEGDFIPEYIYGCRETFNGCARLKEVIFTGTFDTSNVQWFYRFMNGCVDLPEFPYNIDMTSANRNDNCFTSNYMRRELLASNVTESLWIDNCNLDATELNRIFTEVLGTTSGETVYITNSTGAATCDRSIATAKGWTVTG